MAMEDRLEQVLRHYPLGELRDVHRVQKGFVNDNWVITTTRGRFFLKRRHPCLRQPLLISRQHQLIEHLRRDGFPAPRIEPTRAGHSLLILDGEWYEIQEYIEGDAYDHGRAAHLEEAAVTLGQYHRSVASFAPGARHSSGDLYAPPVIRQTLQNLCSAWRAGRHGQLADLFRSLEAEVDRLATRFGTHGSLNRLLIHGDYYADNLLLRGDKIVGVVDYDQARWHPRISEVAEALIYFSSPRRGHLRYIVYPGFLGWEPFLLFLSSYVRTQALDMHEVRALPDYVSGIWLSMSLRKLRERGSVPDHLLEALQEVTELAEWARANADQMVQTASSALRNR